MNMGEAVLAILMLFVVLDAVHLIRGNIFELYYFVSATDGFITVSADPLTALQERLSEIGGHQYIYS